jgi:A/G-specific adenine glycosylase
VARAALGSEPDDVARAAIDGAASAWLAPDEPGAWNEAVMDLGRFVCRPLPRCGVCPLGTACRARARGNLPARRADADGSRRQPAFVGSMRQVRGGIVRELTARPAPVGEAAIASRLGTSRERVAEAAAALARDGLIDVTPAGRLRLRADARP